MASPANFKATGSVARVLLQPEIGSSNVAEVNNEVLHQHHSYIVFGFGRIGIAFGCTRHSVSTKYDRGRSRE
jgi:hypothetical protein